MANTICLSTDMQTLYLIPSSGASSGLSLSGNGVNVSISAGDVTAKLANKATSGTQKSFSTMTGRWTVFYNPSGEILAMEFIGIDAQDTHLTSFNLVTPVNIRLVGTNIVVTS